MVVVVNLQNGKPGFQHDAVLHLYTFSAMRLWHWRSLYLPMPRILLLSESNRRDADDIAAHLVGQWELKRSEHSHI